MLRLRIPCMLICLMLMFGSCPGSVLAESPSAGDRHNAFIEMRTTFTRMETMEDLNRAFEKMLMNADVYQETAFSGYYEEYRYVSRFHQGWEALQSGDYSSAYANFDDLWLIKWPLENAERIAGFVDSLRKYAKAMYQFDEGSYLEALVTFESIDVKAVVLSVSLEMIRANTRACAKVINDQAMQRLSTADKGTDLSAYKQALELFTALRGGGYFLDTERNITYCNSRINEIQSSIEQQPAALIEGLAFTGATLTTMEVSWTSSREDEEYVLTYAPAGIVKDAKTVITRKTNIALEDLIPATQYNVFVSLSRKGGNTLEGSYSTGLPDYYNPRTIDMAINLMGYKNKLVKDLGAESVFGSGEYYPISGNILKLPPYTIDQGEQGYIVLLYVPIEKTGEPRQVSVRAILRTLDAGTYQEVISVPVSGAKSPVSFYVMLNGMLHAMYKELGGWKETQVFIDVLVNDQYFDRLDCQMKP